MKRNFLLILAVLLMNGCIASHNDGGYDSMLKTGAECTESYLPLLTGKSVALVVNHTSLIGDVHLLDTLIALKINVVKIFSPEHGFRGDADAGSYISGGYDQKTGIEVVSLYGKKKKPTPEDLKDVEIVVFDIQDVGVRFYTYLSTMTLVMEACAENSIPFIVFDRPNPNGFYTDGPVLQPDYSSFVGMHPVPVVHGMTAGEYAKMVNEEGWLTNNIKCELLVIPVLNYTHQTLYDLPVKPSPNLADMTSVYLYPSLCFFEGTIMSVGRGTEMAFRLIGHPDYKAGDTTFTPVSKPGASVNPPFKDQQCYGFDYSNLADSVLLNKRIYLQPLIQAWMYFNGKKEFFNNYFNNLAGNSTLRNQIEAGLTEKEIRASWQPGLENFRKIREKYLLYDAE
ncbi:MAG: DUF1343 domain-containing protein [Bacteroidales bacterium]